MGGSHAVLSGRVSTCSTSTDLMERPLNKVLPFFSELGKIVWQVRDGVSGATTKDTWKNLEELDVLMFCHDADRGLEINGQAYAQLLDPVREDLVSRGYRVGVIAHRFSKKTGIRAYGSPFSCNRIGLLNSIRNRLASSLPWLKDIDGSSLNSVLFWERIFETSCVNVIFLIGAPAEICSAAARKGIPVIELLHGFRYTSIPWGYDKREITSLPSQILALDEKSFETFSYFQELGVRIEKVHHPSLNSTSRFADTSIRDSTQSGHSSKPPSEHKAVVLVALQWGYGRWEASGGLFANGLFPEHFYEAIASSVSTLDWIFRLHPVQIRNRRYRDHVNEVRRLQQLSNVRDFAESQGPIMAVLSTTNVVLTPSSGTASEALNAGRPVIFFDPSPATVESLRDAYSEEIDKGMVRFWNPESETLLSTIADLLSRRFETKDPMQFAKKTAGDFVVEAIEESRIHGGPDPSVR